MTKQIKILVFGYSFRKDSFTKAISTTIAGKSNTEMKISEYNISDIPIFNQDSEQNAPENVKKFKKNIEESDALVIVTPEYNYSIPGYLKNAIDWATRPYGNNSFEEKPIAIVSSSPGPLGGYRAQNHLKQIFPLLNAHIINRPEVIISHVHEKVKEGKIVDKQTLDLIDSMLGALFAWTNRIKK